MHTGGKGKVFFGVFEFFLGGEKQAGRLLGGGSWGNEGLWV